MATYDSTYSGRGGRPDLRDRPMHLHWWAVFGGGVVGWGLLFFLSLLGLTIGLAAIEPYSARPAGGSAAAAFLSLLGALLGAGVGAAHVSGRKLSHGRLDGGDRDHALGRTSTAGGELEPEALERVARDEPTILPPTH